MESRRGEGKLSPLECALTSSHRVSPGFGRNWLFASPLECALTRRGSRNSFGMRTYKKRGRGAHHLPRSILGIFQGRGKERSAMLAIESRRNPSLLFSETEFNSRSAGRRYSRISVQAKETQPGRASLPDEAAQGVQR